MTTHAEVEHPLDRKVALITLGVCEMLRAGTASHPRSRITIEEWIRDLTEALKRAGA